MGEWFEWLRVFAEHNQVFSGVAGASAIGGVLYWLRDLPRRAFGWAAWAVTTEFQVANDCDLFDHVERWLEARARRWHVRRLKATAARASRYDDPEDHPDAPTGVWTLGPGTGTHWLWHRGRPIQVTRHIPNETAASSTNVREKLTLRALAWDRRWITDLLTDLHEAALAAATVDYYVFRGNHWCHHDKQCPRPLTSVIAPEGLLDSLVTDIGTFLGGADWYNTRGIPWRRGYLLTGPPGTGKSSVAQVIAGHFKLPVYILNLGSVLNDDGLITAIANVPERALLLIEDIDAASASVRRVPPTLPDDDDLSAGAAPRPTIVGISLSALLNCLDGAMARQGRVLIMASNHPGRLDPALLRPGRVDRVTELPLAGPVEAAALFDRFFPGQRALTQRVRSHYRRRLAPAAIQAFCLAHQDDPDAAASALVGQRLAIGDTTA